MEGDLRHMHCVSNRFPYAEVFHVICDTAFSMSDKLQELFDEFIFECEFSRKARLETLRGYRHVFKTFRKLLPELSLEQLTPAVMTRFFRALHERKRKIGKGRIISGVKKSTIATYWSKLNSFFTWLRHRNHIPSNPFASMQYPKPVYEDRKFLKRPHVERIITAIHGNSNNNLLLLKRNLVIFYLLLFCGLRKEELLLLQIRDFDLERKIITVRAETSKIPRTRHLPLHSQLIMYLRDYLFERRRLTTPTLIVSSVRDDGLSSAGLRHLVNRLKERSGVAFHLHQFRHTFAINFLKSSNNVVKLKQLLGHKDINMTMVYLRCLPTDELRADIEGMSIDSLI